MGRLEGKTAVVTGGKPGIGFALARAYAREGAAVVISGTPRDAIQDAARRLQGEGARRWPSRATLQNARMRTAR